MKFAIVALLAGSALVGQSEAGSKPGQFDYAMILHVGSTMRENRVIGRAVICYVQSSGCRYEMVEAEQANPGFSVASPERFAALAKAMSRLGDASYELVSKTEFKGSSGDEAIVFFKKVRAP